jgi:hypothetical protein
MTRLASIRRRGDLPGGAFGEALADELLAPMDALFSAIRRRWRAGRSCVDGEEEIRFQAACRRAGAGDRRLAGWHSAAMALAGAAGSFWKAAIWSRTAITGARRSFATGSAPGAAACRRAADDEGSSARSAMSTLPHSIEQAERI